MNLSKKVVVVIITLLSPAIIVWYLVTQPILTQNTTEWKEVVSENNLMRHVKVLSSILPKRSYQEGMLNKSAEYIFNELKKYSNDVKYQYYVVEGIEYKNIVAKYGPDDNSDVYVVGAHYDSLDGLPGADDNASGVAGIIELARLFSLSPPPETIQLVAYSLEEPPFFRSKNMGSYHHAKSLFDNSLNVKLMISIEMIGYFSDEAASQTYPVPIMKYFYPSEGNFIAVVGGINEFEQTRFFKERMRTSTPLPVFSINAPSIIPGIDFSDHLNYWLFNYPAIMVTDTSFYRNHNYHTLDDTWEKLNYKKMAMVVQGIYHSLLNYIQRS